LKRLQHIASATIVSLLLMASSGCEKYLSKAPDMRTDLDNIEKIASLLGTAYSIGSYTTMMESASDNAADKGPNAPGINIYEINRGAYMFEDVSSEVGQDSPNYYWNNSWRAIAAANHALRAIEEHDFGQAALPYKG